MSFNTLSKEKHLSILKYINKIGLNSANIFLAKNAVKLGYQDSVEYLMNEGLDPNIENGILLQIACELGRFNIVKLLSNYGANIQSKDNEALILASANGYFNIVEYLVDKGADINARDSLSLHTAVQNGYIDIFEYLIDKGNIKDPMIFNIALCVAINYDQLDIIRFIIESELPFFVTLEYLRNIAKAYERFEIYEYLNKLYNDQTLS